MTSRNLARHRKAARPLTPLSDAAPALRRGLVVAASSGLALTMITSAANAAGGNTQNLERSAGTLSVGPTAEAATLATQNAPIEVDAEGALVNLRREEARFVKVKKSGKEENS